MHCESLLGLFWIKEKITLGLWQNGGRWGKCYNVTLHYAEHKWMDIS